jgi:hypothetical protein
MAGNFIAGMEYFIAPKEDVSNEQSGLNRG